MASEGREELARERIEILFEQAAEMAKDHPERADRYVEIARNIAMKLSFPIPKKYQRRYCPNCYTYHTADRTRTRLKDGTKVVTCLECNETHRFPYKDDDADDAEDSDTPDTETDESPAE